MKKIILVSLFILSVIACKKTEFSPEGPTDVRIRNITDTTFTEVIVSTSEYPEDIDTLGTVSKNSTTDYFRFRKAYPKAQISAKISIGGSLVSFSTGKVDYTYMQYLGQDRVTFEVYTKASTHELKIKNVILDEPLILK